MTLLRNVLIGIVGLVVLVIVAAYVVIATYDRQELRQIVRNQAAQATGRVLTIAGELDIRILPSPAITIEDVTFSNPPWGSQPEMASLKRLDLALDPFALLSGDLRVTRFILIEPEILLETNTDGQANWDIIAPAPTDEPLTLPPLAVDTLVIERGTVTYRDGPTGDKRTLFLDRLEGSLPAPGSVIVTAEGRIDETRLSLNAALQGSDGTFVLSRAELSLGPNTLSGTGSLSLAGPRPKVTAQFSSPLLDLSGLTPADSSAEKSVNEPESPYVFTSDPLPIDGLKTLDLDARIGAERIKLTEKIDVTDAKLAVSIDAGDLRISEIKGTAFGGAVDGEFRLHAGANPAQLKGRITATDMNYGMALKDLDISKDVQGTIDMEIDVAGSGGSMRDIASGLNGRTQIVAKDGIINNKLLAIASTGLADILGPLIGNKKETALKCFVSHFDIASGIATSRAFVLDSSTFTVEGQGTADLRDESLNLIFDTQTREAALVSLAVPFRVTGTLAQPSAKPDPTAILKGLTGAAKALEELVGKPDGSGKKKSVLGGLAAKLAGKPEEGPEGATARVSSPADPCAKALEAIQR